MSTTPVPPDFLTRKAIIDVKKLLGDEAITAGQAQTLLAAIAREQRAVTKQVELSPEEELTQRIARLKQANPALTEVQAQEQMAHDDPELWERRRQMLLYGREVRPPVQKQAEPSYAQIVKMADERRAGRPNVSRRDALAELVTEHPSEPCFHAAYRQYHLADGLEEQQAATRQVANDPHAYMRPWR
jgi:hypothetical protein